ncbi:MAG: gliding motility-associated C-terminal domain-containing protein, partial [Bacteroidota bacterium]
MRKPCSRASTLLILLVAFIHLKGSAQCDPNTLQVTMNPGTCPANGSLTVELSGGPPCTGWQIVLTNPSGIETLRNVPNTGGPMNFTSLSEGDYSLRLINGPNEIVYSGNPIIVTSTYQIMDIGTAVTAPSCPAGANLYAPDGALDILVNSGGTGPFVYEVTSQFGIQNFGPTTDRSHVFGNMSGGESVSFTVTDMGCGVSQTQNPVITNNLTPLSRVQLGEFLRKCSPDCTAYDALFRVLVYSQDGINTVQLAGNSTISVNGGPPQDLTLVSINNEVMTFDYPPGLLENDAYALTFNDGCHVFGKSDTVLPIDNDFFEVVPAVALDNNTCAFIHEVRGNGRTGRPNDEDEFFMFCPVNTVSIDWETGPGSWVNIVNTSSLDANNFTYTLPGLGRYRVTGSDVCHSVIREFNTLPETNSLGEVLVRPSLSILEGTGALVIDRFSSVLVSNATVPTTTYEIRPVPFVPSVTINPGHPFTLGGSYTLNFPITYTTTINRSIIGDLPLGDYEIKVISCGAEATIPFEVDSPALYNPDIQAISGCSNSGRIIYDMGPTAVANSGNDRSLVELWTNDGSNGPGTMVSADIPPEGLSGSFDNLSPGGYILRFRGIRFQSGNDNEVFSAATLNNFEREYTVPVTIAPHQSITATTAGTFCDFSDPTSGIVLTEIISGTPSYPMVFELYETSDLNTAVRTYTETDPLVSGHFFQNVSQGDYLVRVTTPCDALDLNLNLMPASIQPQITADTEFVCSAGTEVNLSLNLPESLYNIRWTDDLGNPLGTQASLTVNINTTSTYTASYSLKPVFCPVTPTETLSITIPLRTALSLSLPEVANCDVQDNSYTLVAELNGTAPYTVSGTGAPGRFNGNIWTSDPIPIGTDYNVDFEDQNACNTLIIADISPNCCAFQVVCPTFSVTTVECYGDIPSATSLTLTEFEALGNTDGSIGPGSCGVIEISARNSPNPNTCNGSVTRTYTVTEYGDANGDGIRNPGEDTILNTVECTQLISFRDNTAPSFVGPLPGFMNASCDAIPDAATLSAIDNCDTNVSIQFSEEINDRDACGANYTLARNWIAEDCTGNVISHTQIISVRDFEAPTFVESLPGDLEVIGCEAVPQNELLTAFDNCDLPVDVQFTEEVFPLDDTGYYEIYRTWTASDCSANEAIHTQMISIVPRMESITVEICLEDDALDLNSLLPQTLDLNGSFEVTQGTAALDGSFFDPLDFGIGEHQISYSLSGENCLSIVDLTLEVHTDCVECSGKDITISKTVTANGDGVNDFFEIKGKENCNYIFGLQIFNRWGNIVYRSDN